MSPTVTQERENRYFASELKFLLPLSLAHQVRGWIRERIPADPHSTDADGDGYLISSIYFDTPAYDVYHRQGSYGRAKFRVRRYGESAAVFLERKLRTRSLVSKRRTLIELAEWPQAGLGENGAGKPAAADWFADRLRVRKLQPVCKIAYHRTAHVLATPHGLCRVTLDEALRASPAGPLMFGKNGASVAVLPEQAVLEMKFRVELPSTFKDLLAAFGLSPSAVSKYRLAVEHLRLVPQ